MKSNHELKVVALLISVILVSLSFLYGIEFNQSSKEALPP
jgi:uncharacterized membrane protein